CLMNKIQVVRGGVILGKLAMRCAHQTPDREVESRGAKLSFVIPDGNEIRHLIRSTRISQRAGDRFINLGVSSAALLVCASPGIPSTGQDQAVLDSGRRAFVRGEPSDGTDGGRDEKKPVRIP